MLQSIKYENLSLNPQHPCKNLVQCPKPVIFGIEETEINRFMGLAGKAVEPNQYKLQDQGNIIF